VTAPLHTLTLTDIVAGLASRAFSSTELTRALLSRIERVEPRLNCLVYVAGEEVLVAAARADAARAAGHMAPLLGVPLAIKDLLDVAGWPTLAGSPLRRGHRAAQDAAVVARLRAAGAHFLGKTATHEWALGTTTANPHFGPTRNPWDFARIPGGSSGGNGAGLAAELFPGAVGSDTGGSIRIPAALCGVVGLKPTRGRLPLEGVVPLAASLDHVGPMARSVADAQLLMAVLLDEPAAGDAGRAGLRGMRVGWPGGYFAADVDADIATAVAAALREFEAAGAAVVDLPELDWRAAAAANGVLLLAEAAAYHRERLATAPGDFGADVRLRLERGAGLLPAAVGAARAVQAAWSARLADLFAGGVDFLLTPTTPRTAAPIAGIDGVQAARSLTAFTSIFNLTGLPAISVPCGFDARGLPIGLQLVGPFGADAALLAVAAAYQQRTDWHTRRPPI
jgi:aspartyl-tRNA(Asn)/glutamyl-tRNA(Gln) amidotransferase subunit A